LELLPKDSGHIPKYQLIPGTICPFISLPESNDSFLHSIDSNLWKNIRRSMRNLEKDYGKAEMIKYDELGSVEKGMDIFFELHQKRWESKLMKGTFRRKEYRDFFTDTANQFANNGWLALYFLTVKDEPIAAQYCIEFGQKMYYVLGGFDTMYYKYSIGDLLTSKVIEYCIKKKIREYDFMRGNEPYKFRWTRQYRRNFGIRFVNSKFTSELYNSGIKLLKQTKLDGILGKYLDYW
jgi:CelD/BcsL family acetyltransferase involved in cellulose biosynthesis